MIEHDFSSNDSKKMKNAGNDTHNRCQPLQAMAEFCLEMSDCDDDAQLNLRGAEKQATEVNNVLISHFSF